MPGRLEKRKREESPDLPGVGPSNPTKRSQLQVSFSSLLSHFPRSGAECALVGRTKVDSADVLTH